ncbi:MAG: methylated-DNA--[protein]-cysteine S-methyltransferase [Polyangiaceae bacterium]|nr:methylated-DNA--[protein]-cysteine S-methyltransferase [Polyangiaceae bacterium]MCE7892700.1 methylated-DNA--[protein]-cysteine S-methyltransferase [Sorangiineae bacterium PRO1]MCL4752154.1 methylated-DNA--[protein]-cysteine S-methyltransferase [Myxococcales bacterium]
MRYETEYRSPIGPLTLVASDDALVELRFGASTASHQTPLLAQLGAELHEYFAGTRQRFDVPLAPEGTAFQRQVWRALAEIPHGQTRSYAEIAARIGRPTATRAVGAANGQNPIAILIPCHRVLGSNGALRGYRWGLHQKEALLARERLA